MLSPIDQNNLVPFEHASKEVSTLEELTTVGVSTMTLGVSTTTFGVPSRYLRRLSRLSDSKVNIDENKTLEQMLDSSVFRSFKNRKEKPINIIVSYGLILSVIPSVVDEPIEFITVLPRFSYEYIEFVKGYVSNSEMAMFYVKGMRPQERKKMIEMFDCNKVYLLVEDFYATEGYSVEYIKKAAIKLTRNIGKYYKFLKKSYTDLNESWGFPKGKKMQGESDFDTALRETVEETKIPENEIKIIENFEPLIDTYTGSDDKVYQSIFYLASIKKQDLIIPKKKISCLLREYISNEIGEIFIGSVRSLTSKLTKNKCDFLSIASKFLQEKRSKEKEIDKM